MKVISFYLPISIYLYTYTYIHIFLSIYFDNVDDNIVLMTARFVMMIITMMIVSQLPVLPTIVTDKKAITKINVIGIGILC